MAHQYPSQTDIKAFLEDLKPTIGKIKNFGNSSIMAFVLGAAGVVCAGLAPTFVMQKGCDHHHNTIKNVACVVSALVASIFYVVGALVLKRRKWFRERRGFRGDVMLTSAMTIISIVLTIERQQTERGIIAQLLVSFSIFALVEISRPRSEYGLLQLFLRLPLQTCFIRLFAKEKRQEVNARLVVACIVIYSILSLWNLYFSRLFDQMEEDKRHMLEPEKMKREEAEEMDKDKRQETRIEVDLLVGDGNGVFQDSDDNAVGDTENRKREALEQKRMQEILEQKRMKEILEQKRKKEAHEQKMKKQVEEKRKKQAHEEKLKKEAHEEKLKEAAHEEKLKKEAHEAKLKKEAHEAKLKKEAVDDEKMKKEALDDEKMKKEDEEKIMKKEAEEMKNEAKEVDQRNN